MRSLRCRLMWSAALVALAPAAATAQKPWIRPEPPCEIAPGHRLVNGAVLQLVQAVESEDAERTESKLIEARDLLYEAITQAGQDGNPAAWYFLGRYYAEAQDARGVDSAFRRAEQLEPMCTDDINVYRKPISAVAMNDAAIAWQGGNIDSAAVLFRLAYDLDNGNANSLLFLASMYAGAGRLDSASKYVRVGSEAAGDDPQFRSRRQRAMLDVARAYSNVASTEPAIGRAAATRWTRDSLEQVIARDSVILADLIAEFSGARLRPQVQARVSRDSGRVAQRLAQARANHAEATRAAAADSVAANEALKQPIEVYSAYVGAFPDDHPAAKQLISYYAATGDHAALNATIDELTGSSDVAEADLIQTGLDLLNSGASQGAARILGAVTTRNPYSRDGLLLQARALYRLRDEQALMDAARRLLEIDPLNQQSVLIMAGAWEVADQRDSTNKYARLANAGIGWQVTVSQFLPSEGSTVLNGSVSNITNAARPATSLVFEFLDSAGAVIGSATAAVPGLQPGAQHRISVSIEQGGAVGWRYRKG